MFDDKTSGLYCSREMPNQQAPLFDSDDDANSCKFRTRPHACKMRTCPNASDMTTRKKSQ